MFEVAADDVAGELFESAFDRWFEQALGAPGEGLRRLLRRREGFDREGPRPIIRAAAWELLQWRDFDTPWQSSSRSTAIPKSTRWSRTSARSARSSRLPIRQSIRKTGSARRWAKSSVRLTRRRAWRAVRGRDYDALEAALLALLRGYDGRWRWKGWGENFGPLAARRGDGAARRACRPALHGFATPPAPTSRRFCATSYGRSSAITKRPRSAPACSTSWTCCWSPATWCATTPPMRAELQHAYQPHLRRRIPGYRSAAGGNPAAARGRRSRRIRLASRAPAARQTVYRRRPQAIDLSLPPRRRRALPGGQAPPARMRRRAGTSHGQLSRDSRTASGRQRRVRAADAVGVADSARVLAADAVSRGLRHAAVAGRAARAAPYSDRGFVTKRQIDESTPDAAGALVRWLVEESGWTVTTRDRPEERVAIEPRHICMLFRRFSSYGRDVTRPYVRALEARHIAHVLVKGGSFNEREEVEALRNALGAIERPDDELAVFATLRGPLFALDDGALLRFRAAAGSLHPFRKLPADLPAELTGDWRRARRAARAAAAGATAGRSPRPSRACLPPCARTRRLQSGRPASRRWPT